MFYYNTRDKTVMKREFIASDNEYGVARKDSNVVDSFVCVSKSYFEDRDP